MANSQVSGMRLEEFYASYLKPAGFLLERDNGAHARIYKHAATGVMFSVGCDEGATRLSPRRVSACLHDLQQVTVRINLLTMARSAQNTEERMANTVSDDTRKRIGAYPTPDGARPRVGVRAQCRICGQYKDLGDFAIRAKMRNGRDTMCLACSREMHRNWRVHGHYLTDARLAEIQAADAPEPVKETAAAAITAAAEHAGLMSDSLEESPETDAAPMPAIAPPAATAVRPEPTPLRIVEVTPRRLETMRLDEFMERDGAVRENDPPAAFVSTHFDFVVIRASGRLFLLTPDAGPGEALTERSAAYIMRLISGKTADEIEGILFF